MIIAIFSSVPGNIARGLSNNQACQASTMTAGSIRGTDSKTVIIVFFYLDILQLTKEKLNCLKSSEIRIGES